MGDVTPLLTASGGFLFAVLWMDLIFDVQVLAHRKAGDELPEPVLASIANYYHRATSTSRPMSRLIALVMVILLGALGFRAVEGHDPRWLIAVSAALAGGPILLALTRTVPNAVRLGNRVDGLAEQKRLARSIYGIICCASGACSGFLSCGWPTPGWRSSVVTIPTQRGAAMAASVKDVAAVVATNRFPEARSWYTRLIGREPDIEPTDGVAEWQLTDTGWLQLVADPQRAGNSAVRIGVTDLAAQITMLHGAGIQTSEPVVIAGMVTVIDIADPDGNEVSYVQER